MGAIRIKVKKDDKYGRLTIIKEVEPHYYPCGAIARMVLCICDCGKKVTTHLLSLRIGRTKSCGCIRTEKLIKSNTIHGLHKHTLYVTWKNMKARCYNKSHKKYKDYGNRGITICDEWLNNVKCFYNFAISHGWEEGLTIDRIDNDGNYEPSNCRFVTCQVNSQNKRTTKVNPDIVREIRTMLTEKISVIKIAKKFDVHTDTIYRINRHEIWANIV